VPGRRLRTQPGTGLIVSSATCAHGDPDPVSEVVLDGGRQRRGAASRAVFRRGGPVP